MSFGPLQIAVKRDAHAIGSGISYGKRYALSAALGVVSDDDDDGNHAAESVKKAPPIERIGPEMAAQVKALIPVDEFNTTANAIFRALNISKLEDIPKLQYNRVVDGLKKKFENYSETKTEVKIDNEIVELDPKS
jgi:hypothetical protein